MRVKNGEEEASLTRDSGKGSKGERSYDTESCPPTLHCPPFLCLYMERYGGQSQCRRLPLVCLFASTATRANHVSLGFD